MCRSPGPSKWRYVMTQTNPPQSGKALTGRRIVLLASVAAVGGALLLAGPGGYWSGAFGPPPASAAVAGPVSDQPMAHPQGFADLVAKVKPAVISVRVENSRRRRSGAGAAFKRRRPATNPGRARFAARQILPAVRPAVRRSIRPAIRHAAEPSNDRRRRLRLLHFAGRLRGDQQPCGRSRQIRPGDDR